MKINRFGRKVKFSQEMNAKRYLDNWLKIEQRRTSEPEWVVSTLLGQHETSAGREQYAFQLASDDYYFPRTINITVYPNRFRIIEI